MATLILKTLPRWGGLALVIVALGLSALYAQAAERVEKGRNVQYSVKSEWIEVSKGHVIGFFENTGVGFHESGDITVISNKGTFDSMDGISNAIGYMTKTFTDGSTYSARWQGTTKPENGYKVYEGTYQYTAGTGRFLGIKGGGNYRGRSHGNMTVVDYEGKLFVPAD